MATPGDTPIPRRVLPVAAINPRRTGIDQLGERRDGGLLVVTVDDDLQGRPLGRGEQENAHDALAVDAHVTATDRDLTRELTGTAHELRRRARMEPELVLDLQLSADHPSQASSREERISLAT
jgi:hypothetical protein